MEREHLTPAQAARYERGRAIGFLVGFLLMQAVWAAGQEPAVPSKETTVQGITLPGYSGPVWGRWLVPEDNHSGVPLGGLGTGFLELRADGRFHDAVLQNNHLAPKSPAGCGLTFTVSSRQQPTTITLLSSSSERRVPGPVLSATEGAERRTPRYCGHFPLADLDFGRPASAPASVWLRAFAPFVPGDHDLSNLPVSLFSVRVRNEGDQPLRVLFVFWWANDLGESTAAVEHTIFSGRDLVGVRMKRAGSNASYALAVQGNAWGVSALPNAGGEEGLPRAQVEAEAALEPGEERRVTFAMAWYAPRWRSSDGRVCLHRYAMRFTDAQRVAEYALARGGEIEARIVAWQQRLYDADLPGWLKDGLLNGLSTLARNTWWLSDGRFFQNESFTGRPLTEPLAGRFNGSFPLLLLFPELEKRTLREFARFQAVDGEIPAGFGSPAGLEAPVFGVQRPIISTEFVLLCWRDYLWTDDRDFLRMIYPHAKRAMQYAMTLDRDGDGLINDAPESVTGRPSNQYYDLWPWWGTSAYVSGIGLAALRAAEEMAKATEDMEFAGWCRERFEQGQRAFPDELFNGRYFRLYSDPDGFRGSETCLANQLCGQWYAWLCDLGDLHPRGQIVGALQSVAALNMQATEWGAISGARPDGLPDEGGGAQSSGVLPGEVWNFATTALMAGHRMEAGELRRIGLTAAERAYHALVRSGTLWNPHLLYAAKDAAPFAGPHHYSNLCLWALPFGYAGVPLRAESVKAMGWLPAPKPSFRVGGQREQ